MIKPGVYKHYKGKMYRVLDVAHHSETGEKLVVYRALYDTPDLGPTPLFVRPMHLFTDTVEVNGIKMPHFAFLHD
jgi:hypothetical protein